MEQQVMTISEAAQSLGVTDRTVHRWIRTGKLNGEKIGHRWQVHIDVETFQNISQDSVKTDNHSREEQLQTEIRYLREQNESLIRQLDHTHQIVAMSQKNIAALTEQLDDSRQMIEDMRSRSSWWKRLFRR